LLSTGGGDFHYNFPVRKIEDKNMPNLVGQTLGRYHIVEQLGEGGMAIVYKAFDTRLERAVALKVIRTERMDDSQFLGRFEREARALAKLTHPNIVHINDYGEHEGLPYLVMDFIPGGTLKERIGAPIPWAEAAWFLAPVAGGLDYAHKQGVIHRDIKPSNILITESGQPMLTDFGIAKMLQDDKSGNLTTSGIGMGTPEYMSPEQVMGSPVDGRTDIYSLGIVFYEMVTGRTPYKADTPMAIAIKLVNDPLPRPRQYVPGLPPQAEQVIFKAVAKQVDDRYLDMGAFAAALEGLSASVPAAKRGSTITAPVAPIQSAEAIPAKKLTFGQRIRKLYKDNSTCVILVIIALVVLMCLCVAIAAIRQDQEKKNAAETAVALTIQPPMNTAMPPQNTSLPESAGLASTVEPTPLPKTSRLKTCSLVPGEPSLDAVFPQDAKKFTQNFNDPYIYYTQKDGSFLTTANGVRLISGPESAAIAALRSQNEGSVIAIRSLAEGEFSLFLLDADVIRQPDAEHKNGIKLGLQVSNQDQNNAVIISAMEGVPNQIASFQYPLRRETLITIDTASHKLTVQDAQGEVIFGTKIPDSISSADSYWVIGDPATDNQGFTRLLLRGICYQDAAKK
jgi:serine/threonine protein kinase